MIMHKGWPGFPATQAERLSLLAALPTQAGEETGEGGKDGKREVDDIKAGMPQLFPGEMGCRGPTFPRVLRLLWNPGGRERAKVFITGPHPVSWELKSRESHVCAWPPEEIHHVFLLLLCLPWLDGRRALALVRLNWIKTPGLPPLRFGLFSSCSFLAFLSSVHLNT